MINTDRGIFTDGQGIARRLLFIFFLLILSSCSTIATIAGGFEPDKFQCDPDYTIPRIYSGIANDIRFLGGDYQDKGPLFWDIPFSLAADTVVLPYTIITQAQYGNLCTKQEKLPK